MRTTTVQDLRRTRRRFGLRVARQLPRYRPPLLNLIRESKPTPPVVAPEVPRPRPRRSSRRGKPMNMAFQKHNIGRQLELRGYDSDRVDLEGILDPALGLPENQRNLQFYGFDLESQHEKVRRWRRMQQEREAKEESE